MKFMKNVPKIFFKKFPKKSPRVSKENLKVAPKVIPINENLIVLYIEYFQKTSETPDNFEKFINYFSIHYFIEFLNFYMAIDGWISLHSRISTESACVHAKLFNCFKGTICGQYKNSHQPAGMA